jgi:hypothetical protein
MKQLTSGSAPSRWLTSSNGPPFGVSIATSSPLAPLPDSMHTVWQETGTTRRGGQRMADTELAWLQTRYRALADQLREVGFIAAGTVTERFTVCASAGCRCHADPPQRHGPYFQHTRKVAGKTVTARLTAAQAERCREQIANRRRLDELVTAMHEISAQARQLPLAQPDPTETADPPDSAAPDSPTKAIEVAEHADDHPTPPQRNDDATTRPCPTCGTPFTPTGRQRHCTPACRQAAWRARHQDPAPQPAIAVPPRIPRRDITVYQCPDCDTRHLGQQWRPDCNRPCVRVDFGGLCPHCDEPITIRDTTDQHPTPPTSP